MADNMNAKEVGFLRGLLERNDDESTLVSESGTFIIDRKGIVQRYEPAEDNPFIEEETEFNGNYTYITPKIRR